MCSTYAGVTVACTFDHPMQYLLQMQGRQFQRGTVPRPPGKRRPGGILCPPRAPPVVLHAIDEAVGTLGLRWWREASLQQSASSLKLCAFKGNKISMFKEGWMGSSCVPCWRKAPPGRYLRRLRLGRLSKGASVRPRRRFPAPDYIEGQGERQGPGQSLHRRASPRLRLQLQHEQRTLFPLGKAEAAAL